jgi:hypothetical protein
VLDLRMLGLRSFHGIVVDLEEHMVEEVALECWKPFEWSVKPCLMEHSPWDPCLMDVLTHGLLCLDFMCNLRIELLPMWAYLVII